MKSQTCVVAPKPLRQRISVTLPSKASSYVNREAKRQKISVSKIMSAIVEEYMDLKEDLYFSALSEKVESETTRYCSHEEAWK